MRSIYKIAAEARTLGDLEDLVEQARLAGFDRDASIEVVGSTIFIVEVRGA